MFVVGEVEPEFEMRIERQHRHAVLGLQEIEKGIDLLQNLHLPGDAGSVAREIGLKEEHEQAALRRRHVERGVHLRLRAVDVGELARRGRLRDPVD